MKTEEEFKAFYESILLPKVTEIDQKRKVKVRKLANRYIVMGLIPVPFIVLLIYGAIQGSIGADNNPIMLLPYIAIIGYPIYIGASVYSINNLSKDCTAEMKQLIIPEMLKFYDATDLQYSPYEGMLEKTIEISNLFDGFNDYETCDYTEGYMGKTFIQFSNCILIASGQRSDEIVFKGIFLVSTFNKNFKGQYMVFPGKKNVPYITIPGQGLTKPELIRLEDPKFNEHFTVYGTDQVEARYLITPALMQRMLDFGFQVSDNVYFSFARNHFFVAFPTKTGKFEPTLYGTINENDIMDWGRDMHHAISIVEEFSLNEHLWSKQ